MTHESVFDRLKARGEEVLAQVSADLMNNPNFIKALQAAMKGKEKFDEAATRALKQMNIPTRTEFKRALHRIEALETELAALKAEARKRKRRPAAPKRAKKAEAPEAGPGPGSPRASE